MCCPCRHPWFCPEVAQGCLPFSTFCPRPSSRLWCGVGWCWGIGFSGCRNQGGYAASWSLDCLCGRPLPGLVCPRSGCKLCDDMGGTRRLYLEMSWLCTCRFLHSNLEYDKVLLYSTGNSAQCYVAAWTGGEFRGERRHGCVRLRPFAVHLKLSQHC